MKHSIRVSAMRRVASFCCALGVLALLVCGPAQAAATASVDFQYNLGGSARYGLIDAGTLYGLIGGRLIIADVSDIANPVEQGSLPTPGIGRRISKKDNILYLACSEGGMVTVDVSDPQNPRQLAQLIFDTTGRLGKTFDVAVRGNYAYVADHTGLHTVDITDPAVPVLKTSFTDFANSRHLAYDLMLDGNYAYLCCEGDGLYIFDISNPAGPAKVSQWKDAENNFGQFYQSARNGNYLYIAGGIRGIVVLDVADVKNPKLVSNFVGEQGVWGGAIGLVNAGTYCYIQDEFFNMHCIDVSDPAKPVETGSFDTEGHHSLGIWNDGTRVVLANSTYGIRILDTAGAQVTQKGAFASPGRVMGCAGKGKYAYLAAGENGLKIYDVSNPAQPVLAGSLALDAFANGIFVKSYVAYIAGLLGAGEEESEGGLLEIVDIENPATPRIVGSVALPGQPVNVTVMDSIAYVALQTKGIAIVDVKDPANPAVLSTYDTLGLCYGVDMLGTFGFLAGADGLDGLVTFDARDRAYPKKLCNSPIIANVLNATVWDTYAYLSGGSEGLAAVDLTLPFLPVAGAAVEPLTIRSQPGQIKATAAFNSYLLAVETIGNLGAVRLFDLASPGNPVEIEGDSYLLGDPLKVSYSPEQGIAYVSSQIAGLYMYSVAMTDEPEINIDGLWLGTAGETGIALELDQAHRAVTGTIFIAGSQTQQGTLTGTISDRTVTAALQPSGTLSLTNPPGVGGYLTGTVNGETAELVLIGHREFPNIKSAAAVLNGSIITYKHKSSPAQQIFLNIAQNALHASFTSADTSAAIHHAAVAEAALGVPELPGPIAAACRYLYPAAYGEALVAQAASQIMTTEICAAYQRRLEFFDTLGDNAMTRAGALAANKSLAMRQYGAAVRSYEKVFDLYRQNRENCPTYGLAAFDGYYEGGIDFGLVQAKLRACAGQSDNGSISGDIYIIVESTGEYLHGVFDTDCVNTGETESVITGTILVTVGEITAHLLIQDWKYNTVSQKWEGSINVVEQDVTGTVSLGKLQDVCPEGWDVIE